MECGIRWREVGDEYDWGEAIAVLDSEPPWGPLSRARNPKTWVWYLPGFDQLQSAVELLQIGNVQRGNASQTPKSKFPKRMRRPWDKRERVGEKKLKGTPIRMDLMDRALKLREDYLARKREKKESETLKDR